MWHNEERRTKSEFACLTSVEKLMGYTRKAIKGISWVGALRASMRGIAVLRTIILARILTPSQFGLVGIAVLVLGLVEMLTETGINVFLVQEEKIEKYINTAWVVSLIRGCIIALLIAATAPFVSQFFNAPDALPLLFLVSLVPFIRGFINPAIVRFQKNLAFDKEFRFRLAIFAVDFLVAITFALGTRDASSLIFGFIAGAIFEVLLSFFIVRPVPKLAFEVETLKAVFHRGKWVTAYSVLNYGFQNGDAIAVGRLLDSFQLGLYQVGYKIATIPQEVVDSVSRVTFPIYTKIGGDASRLRKAFFKTLAACCLFAIPFGLVLFFFTQELVVLFLGQQWLGLVPALKVLAFFGIVRSLSNVVFPLFLAMKKQAYVTVVTLVALGGLALTVIPLTTTYGIVGAGIAALFGVFTAIPFVIYYVWRILR